MVLEATLIERAALRYTPAGLPALNVVLKHDGEATEDGKPRQVSLEIKAVAIGAITRRLDAMAVGGAGIFAGFLSAARNGRGLVFHITALD